MTDAHLVGVDLKALVQQMLSNDSQITQDEITAAVLRAYEEIELQKKSDAADKKAKRIAELEEKIKRKQSGVKSNGIPIASSADPIRSYDDFNLIVSRLAQNGTKIANRNAAIFAVGCATGLRGSDVLRIKTEDIFNKDASYKDRIYLIEKKTGKYQECLITEAIRFYLDKYLNDDEKKSNGFLFKSQMGGYEVRNAEYIKTDSENAVTPKYLSTMLKSAGEACDLPIHISAHTMRHTFACIAYKLCGTPHQAGVQIALNHSNSRVTDGYIKHVRREENDRIRKTVSDFLMGKCDRNLILWSPA